MELAIVAGGGGTIERSQCEEEIGRKSHGNQSSVRRRDTAERPGLGPESQVAVLGEPYLHVWTLIQVNALDKAHAPSL